MNGSRSPSSQAVLKDRRGTWPQAIISFFGPLIILLVFRWALFEPFVIPSGSMIPTLLIHDHILVNKMAYGVHFPFSKKWLATWGGPMRGDIVVFRFPENEEVYYVKRVMALPGEEVHIQAGVVFIDGSPVLQVANGDDSESSYWLEADHQVQYLSREQTDYGPIRVPESQYFVLGDNRNQSNDSRYWGFVPHENLVGRASLIWLSCHQTLSAAQFLCDPTTIRWSRLLNLLR